MYGRHRQSNPWLAGPLEELGLLRILEPGTFVDQRMRSRLIDILTGLLVGGAFDALEIPHSPHGYHELSRTRLGWNADIKLSSELIDGLLQDSPAQNGYWFKWMSQHPLKGRFVDMGGVKGV